MIVEWSVRDEKVFEAGLAYGSLCALEEVVDKWEELSAVGQGVEVNWGALFLSWLDERLLVAGREESSIDLDEGRVYLSEDVDG